MKKCNSHKKKLLLRHLSFYFKGIKALPEKNMYCRIDKTAKPNPETSSKTLKDWVGVQQGQSYLMGRRCLFGLGWPVFYWWCHNKNNLWGRCFITLTSLTPNLFLFGCLKLNLIFDQIIWDCLREMNASCCD